ncbi:predicted protein [Histoplasma mississippiense (nom. inval.)]|uniref:predicted protein n=1 Tax=Ajellomyces capsulatus (strain NAm1 / WU24) TaxID=2059318 RepID=UPI000157C9F3|nr:predicted protein [Histoplasma mississippiense (nom. inval.)]EDN09056.1 predicted protein [Histoplasma mississippiense (nom. inval.)]
MGGPSCAYWYCGYSVLPLGHWATASALSLGHPLEMTPAVTGETKKVRSPIFSQGSLFGCFGFAPLQRGRTNRTLWAAGRQGRDSLGSDGGLYLVFVCPVCLLFLVDDVITYYVVNYRMSPWIV